MENLLDALEDNNLFSNLLLTDAMPVIEILVTRAGPSPGVCWNTVTSQGFSPLKQTNSEKLTWH